MEITNWLSSCFKTGMWHKDNCFLLIDDLHLQKGKCEMNEHEFQSTSQFSFSQGLSLLVEVATNPKQAQEHKPLPLWGWLTHYVWKFRVLRKFFGFFRVS